MRASSAAEKENQPLQRLGSQLRRQFSQQDQNSGGGGGGGTPVVAVGRLNTDHIMGTGIDMMHQTHHPTGGVHQSRILPQPMMSNQQHQQPQPQNYAPSTGYTIQPPHSQQQRHVQQQQLNEHNPDYYVVSVTIRSNLAEFSFTSISCLHEFSERTGRPDAKSSHRTKKASATRTTSATASTTASTAATTTTAAIRWTAYNALNDIRHTNNASHQHPSIARPALDSVADTRTTRPWYNVRRWNR